MSSGTDFIMYVVCLGPPLWSTLLLRMNSSLFNYTHTSKTIYNAKILLIKIIGYNYIYEIIMPPIAEKIVCLLLLRSSILDSHMNYAISLT